MNTKKLIYLLLLTVVLVGCANRDDSNFGTFDKKDINEIEVVTAEGTDSNSNANWSLVEKEKEEEIEEVESEVYDLNESILVHDESVFDMDSTTLVYLSNVDTTEEKYIFTFFITDDEWGKKSIEIRNLIINNNIAIPDESIEFDESEWSNSNSISKITLIAESNLFPNKVEKIDFTGLLKHNLGRTNENASIIRRSFEVELDRN